MYPYYKNHLKKEDYNYSNDVPRVVQARLNGININVSKFGMRCFSACKMTHWPFLKN